MRVKNGRINGTYSLDEGELLQLARPSCVVLVVWTTACKSMLALSHAMHPRPALCTWKVYSHVCISQPGPHMDFASEAHLDFKHGIMSLHPRRLPFLCPNMEPLPVTLTVACTVCCGDGIAPSTASRGHVVGGCNEFESRHSGWVGEWNRVDFRRRSQVSGQ